MEKCEDLSMLALEYARNPVNRGPLENYNGHACITGPCGDNLEFWILMRNNRIKHVSFETDGCTPCICCGSAATELGKEMTLKDALDLNSETLIKKLGGVPERVQPCAVLTMDALHSAIENCVKSSVSERDAENNNRKNIMDTYLQVFSS